MHFVPSSTDRLKIGLTSRVYMSPFKQAEFCALTQNQGLIFINRLLSLTGRGACSAERQHLAATGGYCASSVSNLFPPLKHFS